MLLRKLKNAEKFQASMFSFYRVVKAHLLGMYAFQTPKKNILRNLIYSRKLVQAYVLKEITLSI